MTNEENKKLLDLDARETFSLVPLVLIVVWLGVYPTPILKPIDVSVSSMLELMEAKAERPQTKELIASMRSEDKEEN